MLARLFKLPALLLDFVEKSDVLDSNCRLISEGRDQFDLFIGEGLHFRARQSQDADRDALAQHGDT